MTPPASKANPALFGHCCSPGRCNTNTSPTHTSAAGTTTGSARDCAQYQDKDGNIKSTVDFGSCKTQADCTDAKNSCGGYSENNLIPGEWCSKDSKAMHCCIPGKSGKDCAKGTNSDRSTFDSSSWLECKYKDGCTDKMNDCGGYRIAGVWVEVTDTTPAPSPGAGTSGSKEKKSGGVSAGLIIGIAIGGIALFGLVFMMSASSKPAPSDMDNRVSSGEVLPFFCTMQLILKSFVASCSRRCC
jgi:hypothetical protein